MKNFYREHEPHCEDISKSNELKIQKVLQVIKPICEAFEIDDYDYIINCSQERLILEGQAIGCSGNSIGAVVTELVAYIFCEIYAKNRCLGAFEKQTLNHIKKYWIN